MWGWIKPLLEALLPWLEKLAAKPRTLEDEKTPDTLRRSWADYLRERLRDKNPGH